MRIVITGASGFVGREVISTLDQAGADLVLAGRDEMRLKEIFPKFTVSNYENLAEAAAGFDTLVHLSVLNNDQPGTLEDFKKANVEFLKRVLETARDIGIKTVIYTTSLHAATNGKLSSYAQTKREAEDLLSQVTDMNVVIFRMPAVHGTTFKGKLALLKWVPAFFRKSAFQIVASLKPTVHAKLVAASIFEAAKAGEHTDRILSDRQIGNVFYFAQKRAIDLGFAVFVAVFLWWVMLAAWLAIRLSSKGPAIFAQTRVGKNGKNFTCYKFRTMVTGTKQAATHEVSADNVTSVGRFLRKTKIDELPQIWNIFNNELSLVGPRPCLPLQSELITARSKLGVFSEKGGITGWAQIKGVDMSDPWRLAKLDAEYLDLRGFILDLKIIFATMTGSGGGDRTNR